MLYYVLLCSMRILGILYWNECISCYRIVTLKCFSVMLHAAVYESQHITAVAFQYYHILSTGISWWCCITFIHASFHIHILYRNSINLVRPKMSTFTTFKICDFIRRSFHRPVYLRLLTSSGHLWKSVLIVLFPAIWCRSMKLHARRTKRYSNIL
jgi:hypothetical protein